MLRDPREEPTLTTKEKSFQHSFPMLRTAISFHISGIFLVRPAPTVTTHMHKHRHTNKQRTLQSKYNSSKEVYNWAWNSALRDKSGGILLYTSGLKAYVFTSQTCKSPTLYTSAQCTAMKKRVREYKHTVGCCLRWAG